MSGQFIENNNNTNVVFEYEAPTPDMITVISDAAHFLYREELDEDGVVINLWEDITLDEKLATVDEHIRRVINDAANTFKSQEAQRLARENESIIQHNLQGKQ